MSTNYLLADYENSEHAQAIISMMHEYSSAPTGGGKAIDAKLLQQLPDKLNQVDTAFTILCFVGGVPAGIANCFVGFSTFAGKPLVNIHDLAVAENFRGQGISQGLLDEVSRVANQKGCCKLTLEVLAGNAIAKNAYIKYGFEAYELGDEFGIAQFWEMKL